MSDSSKNLSGKHRQGYSPSLKGGNPEKATNVDWWDELCKKHETENHWKQNEKPPKKEEEEEEDKKKL